MPTSITEFGGLWGITLMTQCSITLSKIQCNSNQLQPHYYVYKPRFLQTRVTRPFPKPENPGLGRAGLAFLPIFHANYIFSNPEWIKNSLMRPYFCYVITCGRTDPTKHRQRALFAVNLQLLNVNSLSICRERACILSRWGFLHGNTLLPDRDRMINILCFLRSYYLTER